MEANNMAIKEQKTIEEATNNNEFDELGLEFEFSESAGSKWTIDVEGLDKIPIGDLPIGATVDGMPEFVLYDNSNQKNKDGSPRKWDNIVLRLVDVEESDEYGQSGEYLEAYITCPRPDEKGNIQNIFGNSFYHGCFNLIYSYLRTLDETNVVDGEGNIKNNIKRINIVKLLEKLNTYSYMEVKIMAGADGDTEFPTYMITEMK